VLTDLLDLLRNVLVMSYSRNEQYLPDLSEGQIAEVRELAARVEAPRLAKVVDLLMEAESGMRHGISKRTVLEMALIRASRAAQTVSIDEVIKQLAALRQQVVPGGAPALPDDKKKVTDAGLAEPGIARTPPPAPPATPPPRSTPVVRPSAPPVSTTPEPKPVAAAVAAPPRAAAAPVVPAVAPATDEPSPAASKTIQVWVKDPKVRMVMDAFNGDILDIR
jgi:DNA polymerase III gamma/tau subunit